MMIRNLAKSLLGQGIILPRKTLLGYMEWSLIRDVINSLEINCVLDVGANKGQYAMNLRRIGYGGHIFSFEPVTEAFTSMAKDFEQDQNWQGYNYALGSENARRTLNVVIESTEMSSFLNLKDPNVGVRKDQVEIKRLDSILDDILADIGTPRIFMKMDTEGYDLEVIKGAGGCIQRILSIQSELFVEPILDGMPRFIDGLALYEQLGFRLLGLSEIARGLQYGNVVAFNCVLARSTVQIH